MTDAEQPEGPRRPPRPPRPDSRPPAAKAPAPARPPGPPAPRTKRPIPEAPGPRPEPVPRAPRPKRPTAPPTGVTFRAPEPPAAKQAPPIEAAPPTPAPARPRAARPDGGPAETHTGRLRRIRAGRTPAEDVLPTPEAHLSPFRRRYGIPYNTQGPKVRLGLLWAIAVVAVLVPQALRPWGLAVLYGVVAGAAAAQIIDAHRGDRTSADRAVAAFAASGLAVAATLGTQALGIGYLLLVVAALVAALGTPERGRLPIPRAGHTVAAAGICGGAAASLVLLAEYEIGALIILLVFVMVYDASDFIVGSGATNGIEGPLAGMLFIAAASCVFAVVSAPPFNDHGSDIWSFSVLAMIACPAGQILASALLPNASAHAPALRRLDSMLVVAPAWAGLIGLYLARAV
ncbi:hypothetical protein ACE2AJ_09020 [Aquihabitans daechungensis]|uniref:hypothetical protein n=1 Tax=Aquihabitans daechungensis TaxID=1052257 RepID=UPI003BA1405D